MQLEHDLNAADANHVDRPEDRHSAIAEAAYQRAHVRNFAPGGELEDWLSAEREVDGK